MNPLQDAKKPGLLALVPPILAELLLSSLAGIIDVAMISTVGDEAVGAVGASGSYLNLVNTAMTTVSIGAGAMMSRYVGAKRPSLANKTLHYSLLLNAAVGSFFSLLFLLFAGQIMTAVGTNPAIYDAAVTYIRVVGASSFFLALDFVFVAYLRAFGKPFLNTVSGISGNVVNVVLNAVFLSQGKGVLGVALATLICRAVSLSLSVVFLVYVKYEKEKGEDVPAKTILKNVFSIGVPAAGESILFFICAAVSMTCINQMDETGTAVAAYSYCSQIVSLMQCVLSAFSSATGVIVGWNIGAGDREAAYRQCCRAHSISTVYGVGVNLVFLLLGKTMISLMTDTPAVLACVTPILAIQLIRTFSWAGTYCYGTSLKTAGDARSILVYGLIFMPLWTFLGSYLGGIVLHLGIYGYWLGTSLDEFSRGILMFLRWKSRKWCSSSPH